MKKLVLALSILVLALTVVWSATAPTVYTVNADNDTSAVVRDHATFWHGVELQNGRIAEGANVVDLKRGGPYWMQSIEAALIGDIVVDVEYKVKSSGTGYFVAATENSQTSVSCLVDNVQNEAESLNTEGATGTLPLYIDIVWQLEDSRGNPLWFMDCKWGDVATSPISNGGDGGFSVLDGITSEMCQWIDANTTVAATTFNVQPYWVDGRSTFTIKITAETPETPTTTALRMYPFGTLGQSTLNLNSPASSETVWMIHK